ncbi:MAG: D-alanyl-D-alanine carboxypeptidase family protein [Fimbriimonadales bacterium]
MRWSAVLLLAATVSSALAQGPEVTAKAAILIDADTGTVLFEKNAHTRRQPASTTKMMTGLLALEKIPAGTMITAPGDIEKIGESSLHLRPGEQLTREDALYALLLRSANDMAHTLAVHIAGSDAAFARMMNERAKAIGCKNTSFKNPHGLPNDQHQTTAYDLALIAKEAMKNEWFKRIVSTQKWFVMRSNNQKDLLVESTNKLLWEDAFVEGVKTGYTRAAGRCFVGSRNEGNLRLISVVLGSEDWAEDTRTLFNWGYNQVELRARYSKGDIVGKVPIDGASVENANVQVSGDFAMFSPASAPPAEIIFTEQTAPVAAGTLAGKLRFVGTTGEIAEYPLVFAEDIPAKPLILTLAGNWRTWAAMGVMGLCFAAFRGRRRPQRRVSRLHAR